MSIMSYNGAAVIGTFVRECERERERVVVVLDARAKIDAQRLLVTGRARTGFTRVAVAARARATRA